MKKVLPAIVLQFLLYTAGEAQDTIQVKAGWNIIGSVAAGAIGEVLVSVPPGIILTQFYGYDPGSGYQNSDTLEKGGGYWIKASADGILIFNPPTVLDSCSTASVAFEGGPYPTVKIGNQCWLAKNLNVGAVIPGASFPADNPVVEKFCYDDDTANCAAYGGLYQWDEAMQYVTTPGTQGICPPGWHIPTSGEYQMLSAAVAGDANSLKAIGQGSGPGAGTDTSGFSALMSGIRMLDGNFLFLGDNGYFWSSTPAGTTHGYAPILPGGSNTFLTNEIGEIQYGVSVRCAED
jgi:uncharacterized protein (TIGR02145 family)